MSEEWISYGYNMSFTREVKPVKLPRPACPRRACVACQRRW